MLSLRRTIGGSGTDPASRLGLQPDAPHDGPRPPFPLCSDGGVGPTTRSTIRSPPGLVVRLSVAPRRWWPISPLRAADAEAPGRARSRHLAFKCGMQRSAGLTSHRLACGDGHGRQRLPPSGGAGSIFRSRISHDYRRHRQFVLLAKRNVVPKGQHEVSSGAVSAADMSLVALEFLRNPTAMGAIAPSSGRLAEAVVAPIPRNGDPLVVELGSGTGAFTRAIQERLGGRGHHLAVELNPRLAELTALRYPAVEVVQQSAAHLPEILASRGLGRADVVVSGLPWAAFPAAPSAVDSRRDTRRHQP